MCVTNTTHRRQQPISLLPPDSSNSGVSGLTQRLLGTFELKASAPTTKSHEQYAPVAAHSQVMVNNNGGLMVAPTIPSAPGMACLSSACPAPLAADQPKPRPKRRRKPQKPGKTAKMNERHFVVHNYHDHAGDAEDLSYQEEEEHEENVRRKGGVAIAFPVKLHAILDQVEQDGLGHVISWQAHGRCFAIHQPKIFVDTVMPKYFRQTKLTSFQRQLNLYGFCRLTKGADAGGYYHELFLRGKPFLTKRMIRTKVKGTRFKAASSPEQEPDFYSMPPVVVSPHASPQHQSHVPSDGSVSETSLSPVNDVYSMFKNTQAHVAMEPASIYSQFIPPSAVQVASSVPAPIPFSAAPASPVEADEVLDEAVDQLFLNGPNPDLGDLNDFVHDWDPNSHAVAHSLENDIQLGYMLDRLLAD